MKKAPHLRGFSVRSSAQFGAALFFLAVFLAALGAGPAVWLAVPCPTVIGSAVGVGRAPSVPLPMSPAAPDPCASAMPVE